MCRLNCGSRLLLCVCSCLAPPVAPSTHPSSITYDRPDQSKCHRSTQTTVAPNVRVLPPLPRPTGGPHQYRACRAPPPNAPPPRAVRVAWGRLFLRQKPAVVDDRSTSCAPHRPSNHCSVAAAAAKRTCAFVLCVCVWIDGGKAKCADGQLTQVDPNTHPQIPN